MLSDKLTTDMTDAELAEWIAYCNALAKKHSQYKSKSFMKQTNLDNRAKILAEIERRKQVAKSKSEKGSER
jgi:hypothetical protein